MRKCRNYEIQFRSIIESISRMFGMGVAFRFLLNFEFYEYGKIVMLPTNISIRIDWRKPFFCHLRRAFLRVVWQNKRRKICVVNSEEPANNLIFVMCLVPHKLHVTISPASMAYRISRCIKMSLLLSIFANCEKALYLSYFNPIIWCANCLSCWCLCYLSDSVDYPYHDD